MKGLAAMKASARREEILKYLQAHQTGYTAELCRELDVSAMTIRRDFEVMAGQGLVTLIRGGAALNHGTSVVYSLKLRQTHLPLEKQRIAQRCADMVCEGNSVFIDCGSTAERIGEALRGKKNITVLTNSLDTAQVLSTAKGIKLIMVPGEFNEAIRGFTGLLTTDFIQRFRIDYIFLGANGIDASHGMTVPDYADAETKRVLIRQSRHVIVAADHAKLGSSYFEIVARLPEIEAIVTDSDADETIVQELRADGTEVILV
ncbi:DeoR/GlpR family DNA-binding transcription regulator [Selenomonas sp. AB3002]|uniref:DeoR/GlpR family DNA-binding transcription regulator n=1 Tax=Selenomonas sp. AB3002 TaxID=1392502 RepID=UPI0005674153